MQFCLSEKLKGIFFPFIWGFSTTNGLIMVLHWMGAKTVSRQEEGSIRKTNCWFLYIKLHRYFHTFKSTYVLTLGSLEGHLLKINLGRYLSSYLTFDKYFLKKKRQLDSKISSLHYFITFFNFSGPGSNRLLSIQFYSVFSIQYSVEFISVQLVHFIHNHFMCINCKQYKIKLQAQKK